jgi:uncharacterized protein YcgI (DUF1989 family)
VAASFRRNQKHDEVRTYDATPDAALRRRAQPVLTYPVEQLPPFDAAFYNGARAELSKVAELTVPPRDAKAFKVPAGHFFRIVSVGPASRRSQPLERA